MKINIAPKLLIYFSFLIVFIIITVVLLSNTEDKINEQHDWVLQTHKVIQESERFLGYMRDAETGQRGYLLTLDEQYLEPFHNGIENANLKLETLKVLTQDNLEQQTRLKDIQKLVEEKISELETTIQLAKQDNIAEAMSIVSNDKGKLVMDSIRKHISEFLSKEELLLKKRTDIHLADKQKLRLYLFLESVFLIMLIIISYFLYYQLMSSFYQDRNQHELFPGILDKYHD